MWYLPYLHKQSTGAHDDLARDWPQCFQSKAVHTKAPFYQIGMRKSLSNRVCAIVASSSPKPWNIPDPPYGTTL